MTFPQYLIIILVILEVLLVLIINYIYKKKIKTSLDCKICRKIIGND